MPRIPELDAVRGIAAVAVVLFHYTYPGAAFRNFFFAGWMSLEVFFVLSGYLITRIILDNGEKKGFYRNFYMRRSLRIWPIYYIYLLTCVLIRYFRPGLGSVAALPQYLTFTQNVELYGSTQKKDFLFIFEPTWSLAVEEQFYLIWPVLILVLGIHKGRSWRLVFVAFLAVLLSVWLRYRGFSIQLLLARSDGFAIGGVLAILTLDRGLSGLRRQKAIAISALAAGIGYLTIGHWLMQKPMLVAADCFSMTAAAIAAMGMIGLLIGATGSRVLAPLRNPALLYLGKISYGIYLFHLGCLVLTSILLKATRLPDWLLTPLSLSLCIVVSIISWESIESPILKLKNRFRYEPPGEADRHSGSPVKADEPSFVIDGSSFGQR